MNFKDLNIKQFKKDDTITVVKMSDFGYPISIPLKLESIEFVNYAQYTDCIAITGKLPRKRKMTKYIIRPYQQFAIYRGIVKLNETTTTETTENFTITSFGLCFDENTFKKSLPDGAVISSIEGAN